MSHNVYKGKPEEGKVYALTGGPKAACIANGNTWAESEIENATRINAKIVDLRKAARKSIDNQSEQKVD